MFNNENNFIVSILKTLSILYLQLDVSSSYWTISFFLQNEIDTIRCTKKF